jgi:hypothetical protein
MSGAKRMIETATASGMAPLFSDALVAGIAARMKQIAAASGDHLFLSDGPVNPDWELLDLCGDALHFAKAHEKAWEEWSSFCPSNESEREVRHAQYDEMKAARKSDVISRVRRAGKMRATTPAGIYAKAMLVRFGTETAAVLAMSLAEDLLDCEALRLTLWPAGGAA